MRSLLRAFLPLLALLFAAGAAAQSTVTALPFLEIPASPSANALGGAAVALPTEDPYAFLANPAHLGLAARDVRALTGLYPGGSTDWLAVGDLQLGSAALAAGFDLRPRGLPLTVGVGLGQTALRFGERVFVDGAGETVGAYEPQDRYHALGFGIATAGALRVGLGATVRHVSSTDRATVDADGVDVSNVWGFTFDAGLLAEADVTRLLGQPRLGPVRPALSLSAGYAQSHIGGSVRYSDQYGRSALPRTATLGWSATAGLDLPLGASALRLVEGDLAIQAEHSLVRRDDSGRYRYAATLGDLKPLQNAFFGRGDAAATARHGVRVTLAETLALSQGGFDGWGFDDVQTRGLEVRLAGPLKVAAALTGQSRLAALADRFDVRFSHTVYFAGTRNESTFDGLTLVVRR